MASTSYSSTPVLSRIGLVHGDMASLLWQTSLLSRQCHAPLHIDGYVHRYARYIGVVRLGGWFVTNSPPHLMSPNAMTEHHNSQNHLQPHQPVHMELLKRNLQFSNKNQKTK